MQVDGVTVKTQGFQVNSDNVVTVDGKKVEELLFSVLLSDSGRCTQAVPPLQKNQNFGLSTRPTRKTNHL